MLESSFSRVRFVFLVQGNDFKATSDRALESSFSRVRFVFLVQGNTDRMLESSFSRVRFVFLVQGKDWSNVGKLVFKSSIRFLGSGQRLIECWKARFQEFDSFSWFRARTDRMLESSFSRVRFVFLVQGNDWSNVGKLIFKSSIRLLGSGQRLIECWKAHFQEFDSFSRFRATTDRMLESSFSRVRFVFLVQGNDWSNVGKLIFKSSIRFLGSGQGPIECWKAHFQEFDSFSWFRATTDRMLESSFSRVQFVYLVQGNDWSSVGKLIFKSSIRFLGSGQRLIECWKAHFQEFDSFSWFRATTEENESNSWKRAFQRSISRCPEPSKRIELLKMSFPTLDQSLPWTKKTNRTLENELSNIRSVLALNQENESNSWKELSNIRSVVALNHRALESSFSTVQFVYLVQGNDWSNVGKLFSRVRFVFLVQGKDWSNVGKLVFKSSIRFLGSGQRLIECWKALFKSLIRFLGSGQGLIECWKARFQEFDSFSWFRARTDRAMESSFSRVQFVYLVQGNDWSNVGKLIFRSSIRLLGSGQRLKETNRTLENELSNARSVVALNQENESNSSKWAFQRSISRCPEQRKRIELLKMSFPTFDQSLPWTKKTNRTLENELSNTRSVVALNQENESNSWKRAFQRSISRCPEPRKRIELLKMSFPTFDQSLPWTKKTNRTLENELSNIRSVLALNQENESNSWKRAFQHSISRCPEPSNVGKLIFKSSIRFLGSGQRLKKTNRTLENELSNIRSVVALNQENESNSWKWAFQHSISPCPEPRKRIELLKTSFPTFDQSLPWTKKTNRTLENELSNARSVVALNQVNELNSWKWAFQRSISRCPEPSKWIELLKTSFPTFDQSLPWTIERWKAHFQEFNSFTWFRATTDRMLESSFSRVRFIYLVQGNDWSNVGKLIFKSSIRFLGSGQRLQGNEWSSVGKLIFKSSIRFLGSGQHWSNVGKLIFKSSIRFLGSGQGLIECWKARFQEFDSFSWFRATTDRMLESSFSRVRFVFLVQGKDRSNVGKLIFKSSIRFLVQGNDWSNVGKLIFKSSIRLLGSGQRLIECWKAHFQEFDSFLGSGQRLIECWKAHFQEFDSFSWFRATTDRMLESSFSRVRFVFSVQGKDRSNVGKLIFKSSIRFLGSGQRLIECWKAHFQEFNSFTWFRATTDRVLESSFSRVRFVFSVQGNDWSNVGKLIFKSSIRFLGSGQRLRKTNRTLENELSNARSVVALNQVNELNCWKWAFQRSISRCPEPRKRIELLKTSFPTFDQSLPWTKKTNRTLEKSFPTFDQSLPWTIERWKAHFQQFNSFTWFRATTDRMLESSFQEFDSFSWFRARTDRMLESSFSRVRFVSWFRATTDRMLESSFQEFDSFSWFRARTDRMLESSFSRVRFVFLVQGKDWSSNGKLVFKSSIRLLGSGQRLIECWKAHFQEFDSFTWFRATTDRMLESSFSRVRFVFLVQGKDRSNVGKLIFKSSIRFLGSGQRLK